MQPPYLAADLVADPRFEAFESQPADLPSPGYISARFYAILSTGCTQVTVTSQTARRVRSGPGSVCIRDRSSICPRALRAFLPLPWLPWRQLAHNRKKNMSWSSPSPFRKSPSTPVNSSNRKTQDQLRGPVFLPGLFSRVISALPFDRGLTC